MPLTYLQFDQIAEIFLLWQDWCQDPAQAAHSSDYINHLRPREGIADEAMWDLTKALLPPRFRFLARKVGRAVRSDLHLGAKGLDPFNCALNALFTSLREEIKFALDEVGFDKHFPGVGLLHHRHRDPPVIEHRNHQGFTFDFMDPYRPLFRYYLLLAFQPPDSPLKTSLDASSKIEAWCATHQLVEEDFKTQPGPWNESIATLEAPGKAKLERLAQLIMTQPFPYQAEVIPLWKIMRKEAESFKSVLKREVPMTAHPVFSLLESIATEPNNPLVAFYRALVWLLKPDAADLSWEKALDKAEMAIQLRERFEVPFTSRFKNVILVTHVDADGFLATLHLIISHFRWLRRRHGQIRIIPTTPDKLHEVLQEKVPRLLWTNRREHNRIIVADFEVKGDQTFFRNLRHRYLSRLEGLANHLEMIWYDHHPLPAPLSEDLLQRAYGITLHHTTSAPTYQIVREALLQELNRYHTCLQIPQVQGTLGLFTLFLCLLKLGTYQKLTKSQKEQYVHLQTDLECYLGLFLSLFSRGGTSDRLHTQKRWASNCQKSLVQANLTKFIKALDFKDVFVSAAP